jgi:thiamine biosynthesis lipoprotein
MPMSIVRTSFRAMASDNELQLDAADAARAGRAADAAIADVLRIEAKYSRYRNDSVTTRINRAAGRAPVAIDAETAALLAYADRCHTHSGGRFDLTSGVLRRAWNFRGKPPRLPDEATLATATALIGWADVEWSARAIRLPRAGMEIDFGGIGKEYAADRMAAICVEHGIAHGLVNLGGDVRAIGTQPDGAPWRVGIRHPRDDARAVAYVDLADGAVATSGDYERYFDLDGRRYCHILDPRTGMPVAHWQSVSVVAPLCVVAGSCSTIAMLMEAGGEAFLESQGLDYVAVAPDGTLRVASRTATLIAALAGKGAGEATEPTVGKRSASG